MDITDKKDNILENDNELEMLYQIYLRVQSGDKAALDELFQVADRKQLSISDKINKEYRKSNMDNVLDSELVLANEKNKNEEEWVNSSYSGVVFKFACLNKMLYKKKKRFLLKAKNTAYENEEKNLNYSKFYEGEYDITDFNELMYETIIEIFNEKTDEDNCLTLDGKKNEGIPIYDGISLLKNISYFTSRKINKRERFSSLNVSDIYYNEEFEEEVSNFDKYAVKEFLESGGNTSRLTIYAEYLQWLKRNDIHKLFKTTACDINAIIETIMNCDDTFVSIADEDIKTSAGMSLVKQRILQKIIKSRHNINIKQENISKDIEIIEQRLLDHLYYSLNYKIGKAVKSKGIYEKESERWLYELDKKSYIKIFTRASYEIYDKSIGYIENGDFYSYSRMLEKYDDMIIDIVSVERGKKKYDMINLMLENCDLVDHEKETMIDIAVTLISYYQKNEEKYKKDKLGAYKINGLMDWENGYWEAELKNEVLNIRLWTSKNVKKPIRYNINEHKLIIYCGYVNFYFCDIESKICYTLPKNRRIISRSNKNHEIFMYEVA